MSSTPVQEYAILDEVKLKLNIITDDTSQDLQITVTTNDSNNYIAEQTAVHATVVVAGNDPSLSSMANNLAAAYFNFWISSEKDREELERWQDRIQQYIMAKYGKKSANMLSGEETIGVTSGFVSTSAGTSTDSCDCSPLTTKGDIWGYSNTDTRVPVGADSLILTADSGNPLGVSWQVPVSGLGDVVGPDGATDEAIARYDDATGKLIQNSGVLIDDSDNVTGVTSIAIGDGTWIISEDGSDELLFTSPTGDGTHGIKVVSDTGEIILENTVSATNDYTSILSTGFTDAASTTTAIAFSIQSNITTASDSGTEPITQIQGKANNGAVSTRPIFGFYNFTTKLWEIDNYGTVDMQSNSLENAVLTTPTITDFTNAVHDHEDASGGGTLIATNALTATGTKDPTTFLRGDDTWAVPGGGGDMLLAGVQTVTGAKTFEDTTLLLRNIADTFNGSFVNTNTADRVYTLQDSSDVLVGRATTDTFTNKTLDADGTGNVITNIGSSEIKSEMITGFATVSAASGDFILISDTGDSGNLKKVDALDFLGGSSPPFDDATALVSGSADATKLLRFEVDGQTTGIEGVFATTFTTAKTLTFPDATDTVVARDTTDTLTNKSITYSGRAQWDKGANVASPAGGILTLGTDGNVFTITGVNTINEILATGWQAGSVIILEFSGVLTVTNNSGGTNDILLGDGANYTTAAGESLELWFDGTDWREISRSVFIDGLILYYNFIREHSVLKMTPAQYIGINIHGHDTWDTLIQNAAQARKEWRGN